MRVRNLLEASILINEAIEHGDFHCLDGEDWITHDGEYLFHSEVHGNEIMVSTGEQTLIAMGLRDICEIEVH